ncbi:MAG: hypothetical protein QGF53_03595 [Alphaproteobacteria bacterium]|nr:hypothetical protein [Alphaproteobacteria bacterium]
MKSGNIAIIIGALVIVVGAAMFGLSPGDQPHNANLAPAPAQSR